MLENITAGYVPLKRSLLNVKIDSLDFFMF